MRTVCGFLSVLFAAVLLFTAVSEADAARFGGGRSFGGKSSYSRSAPAPRTQQQARKPADAGRQAAPGQMARPGMGGFFGGLLAGSILGSLLFGGPHAGFGMMDIILVVLVGFLGLRLLRAVMARRDPQAVPDDYARAAAPTPEAGGAWEALGGSAGNRSADGPNAVPGDFDQEDFLRGAKMLFTRLQDSWDKRDVEDIATFVSPAILAEVTEQAGQDPDPSSTEVLLINASLVSVDRSDGQEVATVFFDVLVRENPEADSPSQVRELWHLIRPLDGSESWRLDGIQQVE